MIKMPLSGVKFNFDKGGIIKNGIVRDFLPNSVFVPICFLKQHEFLMRVKIGDSVRKGQILAQDVSDNCAIYSPYNGKITQFWDMRHPFYRHVKCVELKVDENQDGHFDAAADISYLNIDTIVACAKNASLVDEIDLEKLYVKLGLARQLNLKAVAVVANDDQPYMSSNTAVLIEHSREIQKVLDMLMRVLNCTKGSFITYGDVSEHLEQDLSALIDIKVIKGKYPYLNEMEKTFDDETFYIGAQCALALYNACVFGLKQTSIVVSVDGDCIENPANFEVGYGTQVSDIIERCNVVGKPGRIITGGPLTGRALSPSSVIFPALTSITISTHTGSRKSDVCIGCGKCGANCPVKLTPSLIIKDMQNERFNTKLMKSAENCVCCGICSYVCPSGINIKKVMTTCANLYTRHS